MVIARPAAAIFPWISQPKKQLEWVDGLRRSASVPHTKPGLGGRWTQGLEIGTRSFPLTITIVRFDPPRVLGWVAEMDGGFVSNASWTLTEQSGRTTIVAVDETRYVSPLSRAFGIFAVGATNRKMAADLSRLRGLVEASRP